MHKFSPMVHFAGIFEDLLAEGADRRAIEVVPDAVSKGFFMPRQGVIVQFVVKVVLINTILW